MNYEPLYKFSHILDEFSTDPQFQLKLIRIRVETLREMFQATKEADLKQTLYDDMNALNVVFARIFKTHNNGTEYQG